MNGFNVTDLTLTKDGGPNLITAAQTLTTTDNTTFVIGNLSPITNQTGTYTLTLNAGTSGITSKATGKALANSASASFGVDASPPTASGSGPTVTSPTAPATFTVTYSDPAGVDVSTLDSGDVFVSGPAFTGTVPVTLVSVDRAVQRHPAHRDVQLAAPGGRLDDGFERGLRDSHPRRAGRRRLRQQDRRAVRRQLQREHRLAHADAHADSDAHTDPDSYSHPDSHPDADTDADAHSDADARLRRRRQPPRPRRRWPG